MSCSGSRRQDCRIPARAGFTLIELLVVIAIIAILAAILFPVFSSVREKARQTSCLSNVQQIGTALEIYVQDNDEQLPSYTTPSVGATLSLPDYWTLLEPYTKTTAVFYCPDRTDKGCSTAAGYNEPLPDTTCIGYGYNQGPYSVTFYSTSGTDTYATPVSGLFSSGTSITTAVPGTNPVTYETVHLLNGVMLSGVTAPASTFSVADTMSGATSGYRATMIGMAQTLQGASSSGLRHSGRMNMSFVDGHVKAIAWHAGLSSYFNESIAMPVNSAYYDDWCADPNAPTIDNSDNVVTCDQQIQEVVNAGIKWYPN